MTVIPPPILKGPNIVLRRAKPDDADARLTFGSDPHIQEMFGVSRDQVRPMTRERAAGWAQSLIVHPHAWVIDRGGLIGEVRLDRVDMQDRRASFAIGIFDPASLGQGIGTEACRLVLGHAFGTIGLHRVSLRVLAFNTRAIRSYEKCGFVVEGRERETAFVNGRWHDDLIMGILEDEVTG